MEAVQSNSKAKKAGLLGDIYRNVTMASDSLLNLMPKVNNEDLKTELSLEFSKYEDFATRAKKALFDIGEEPKEENIMAKMSAKMGVAMNTLSDSSTSHLAQMLVEGSAMGITNLIRVVKEYNEDDDAQKLAHEVIAFEEERTEKLKRFL